MACSGHGWCDWGKEGVLGRAVLQFETKSSWFGFVHSRGSFRKDMCMIRLLFMFYNDFKCWPSEIALCILPLSVCLLELPLEVVHRVDDNIVE